jgi:hypothetical protein
MKPNEKFNFEIKKGTNYHELSGPLSEDLSNKFRSLLDFKFYFKPSLSDVRYNRWNFWLIHGLSESTRIEDFSKVISIKPESKFVVKRINLGTLQLCGSFEPLTSYEINIKGSNRILDGFDLPLVESSTKFNTGPYSDFMQVYSMLMKHLRILLFLCMEM